MRILSTLAGVVVATFIVTHAASATVLETYEFQGQTGSQTSVAPSFVAANLTGVSFGELNLTPSAGANSINASGWTGAGAAYTFGFSVLPGYTATIDQLLLSTRSSGTGPGFLSIQASVNGAAYATVASLTQNNTNFNDQMLSITPVTGITGSVSFRIVAANQISAAGGTVGSAGTFRVGDYNPSGTPTPFTLNGTLSPLAVTPTPVPEPATLALVGSAVFGGLGLRRRLTSAAPPR